MKSIGRIVAPVNPHFVGDGFRVHGFIPSVFGMQETDPFLILDYNSPYHFGPSNIPRGVGVHPHKGFETVTIAYQGKVEHADSSGGGGVIQQGDVQWMTAGNGILHKEFHESEWSKEGGVFQMVQLWVNLPAKHKSTTPKYQNIQNTDIPKIAIDDLGSEMELIAGTYKEHQGVAETFTPVHLFNLHLKAGADFKIDLPKEFTTALIAIEGNFKVNDETVKADHFVYFKRDGEEIHFQTEEDVKILVMSGEPIKEPIAAHGPFVMNSKDELIQAFQDFNEGKMGYLE